MTLRIIAGELKGRKLATVPGMQTRPTADRVRESIFNIIGAGVRGALVLDLFAGTGAMGIVPGFSIHDELRILVESGFTPYEAIATGTVNASTVAEAMAGKDDFGTIEVGKRADFILVNRNPFEDAAHIKDHRGVMAAGEWYDAAYLQAAISPGLIPGIPVEGNVIHVRQPDNSKHTN